MKYNEEFENLVCAVANLGKKTGDDEKRMATALEGMIRYFNKKWGYSFQSVQISEEDLKKPSTNAFMQANDCEVRYNVKSIKSMKKKIQQSVTKEYNPDYDDITYALFIVNAIAHEITHCVQDQQLEEGKLSFEIYSNALSMGLTRLNPGSIPYRERSYEQQAFGVGAGALVEFCNKGNLSPTCYRAFERKRTYLNFFSKNITQAEIVYHLGIMPFVRNQYGFVDLISYANDELAKLNQATRNAVFSEYPQLSIGMNKNGKRKNPIELINQFQMLVRDRKIKCEELYKIYVYLFVPLLTKDIYSDLCFLFGEKYMEKFMIELQKSIKKMIYFSEMHAEEALKGVSFFKNKELEQKIGINKQYVELKRKSSLDFLQNSYNMIHDCLQSRVKK